jgi:hypothetical protein
MQQSILVGLTDQLCFMVQYFMTAASQAAPVSRQSSLLQHMHLNIYYKIATQEPSSNTFAAVQNPERSWQQQ